MNLMTFRSAVDTWFYLVVIAAGAIVIAAFFPVMATGSSGAVAAGVVSAIVAIGLPLWLLASTRYTVTHEMLIVRSGPFRWHIPRSEISQIQSSRSLLSSPALSLDRLEIKYGAGKSLLVSPADKEAFVRALGFSA